MGSKKAKTECAKGECCKDKCCKDECCKDKCCKDKCCKDKCCKDECCEAAIDPEVEKVFNSLNDELKAISDIDIERTTEIEKIIEKYDIKKRPLLKKRDEKLQTIPHFWKQCFMENELLKEMLKEKDQEILDHLTYFRIEESATTLKAIFGFEKNKFFSNTELFREVPKNDNDDKVKCSKIEWTAESRKAGKKSEPDCFFDIFFDEKENDTSLVEMLQTDIYVDPVGAFTGVGCDSCCDDEDEDEDAEEEEDDE